MSTLDREATCAHTANGDARSPARTENRRDSVFPFRPECDKRKVRVRKRRDVRRRNVCHNSFEQALGSYGTTINWPVVVAVELVQTPPPTSTCATKWKSKSAVGVGASVCPAGATS